MERDLLARVVVPRRLALLYRQGETVGYNPTANVWHRLDPATAETLRWLRAGRDRRGIAGHLAARFDLADGARRLEEVLRWSVLRRLLFVDVEPAMGRVEEVARLDAVYWISTQACNLRCTYCYQDATVARPHELTTEEGLDLVDQAVEAGAGTFVFTGGEPFHRRDLLRIARHSRERGLQTNVITNGHYITPSRVKEVAATFDRVTVSLDHGRAEVHDHFRGAGSWRRAARAIDMLLEAGVAVDVNSTVTRLGLSTVEDLLRFVGERRIDDHRIVPQYPMGRGGSSRDNELDVEQLLEMEDDLYRTAVQIEPELPAEGSSCLHRHGSGGEKGLRRSHCGAGLSEVSVDPEGWVYPCKLLQYGANRAANVRQRRLAEIYATDPVLVAMRRPFTETLTPCKTCIVRHNCGGGCRGIHTSFSEDWRVAEPLFCAQIRRTFELEAFASTGGVPARRPARFVRSAELPTEPPGSVTFIPLGEVRRR